MSIAETTAIPSSGALREVIRQNNARFEQAIERQDAAALAALYTEDAHVMPSNSAAIESSATAGMGGSVACAATAMKKASAMRTRTGTTR